MRSKLEILVENFDREPAQCRDEIRELMERDSQSFYAGAIRILKAQSDSRGLQYIVGLLVTNEVLITVLCDPELTRDQAIAAGRTALQVDPLIDVKLARQLAEEAASGGSRIGNAMRVLDILAEISSGARISTSLMRLLRHSDPQMRSKAVLIIGRSNRSVKWLQDRLGEADPRTRANAIEALWGVKTSEAKELLQTAARDGNNRVAGNALIALYRSGECSVIPELFKMADSDSPLFRSTAAWVMGETGDPRFSGTLARLLGEHHSVVRKRAFAALAQLRAANSHRKQGQDWKVAAHLLPAAEGAITRQLRIEARPADGGAGPKLLGTQFILSEDGQQVQNYQIEERQPPDSLSLHFILPKTADPQGSAWVQGALSCLAFKRAADSWAVTRFVVGDGSPGDAVPETGKPATPSTSKSTAINPADRPIQFTVNNEVAAAALQNAGSVTDSTNDLWSALRQAVQPHGTPSRVRNLIVYSQAENSPPISVPELISASLSSRSVVQAISLVPFPALEELCRRTHGSFQIASSEPHVANLIGDAHGNLVARFTVTYPLAASAEPQKLTVRVFDATNSGETEVNLPGS